MSDEREDASQRSAEAEIEKYRCALGPFVVAAQDTRMPMVFTNALERGHRLIFANDSFLKLTRYAREDVLGEPFGHFVAPRNDPDARRDLERSFAGEQVDAEFACLTRDGREIWVSLHVSPVRNAQGEIIEHFASLFDLTRHRDEQQRAGTLIDELNHRVKNNLAALQSFVRLSSKRLPAESLGSAIEDRVLALARAQDLLLEAHRGSSTLRRVIEMTLASTVKTERLTLEGPDLLLSPNQSCTLSLVAHELLLISEARTSVARRSAFFDIRWQITDTTCVVYWQAMGAQNIAESAERELSVLLIERRVVHELGGMVRFERPEQEFRCTLNFPLTARGNG